MSSLREPTFFGFVATTLDAAIVVDAAIQGQLPLWNSAPTENELDLLISSGSIFVHGGGTSDIIRWRDRRLWSDRRAISHGFDIYRELAREPHEALTAAELQAEDAFWNQAPRGKAGRKVTIVNDSGLAPAENPAGWKAAGPVPQPTQNNLAALQQLGVLPSPEGSAAEQGSCSEEETEEEEAEMEDAE
ncbi:hypothetical protein VTJ49DRAFT_5781 [Mycothermus thermophilus]|uniref:Uncharacterized protein n=1 Tax=Humicola insolens TaxID=85995 RepID=A0ABR3VR68_HUMIN